MSIWTIPKKDHVGDEKAIRNNVWDITEEDYEVGKTNGICRERVYSRVYKGMTVEDAITRPIANTRKGGYGPWNQWKDKAEVCRATFYRNLENGMSPEEAIKRRYVR